MEIQFKHNNPQAQLTASPHPLGNKPVSSLGLFSNQQLEGQIVSAKSIDSSAWMQARSRCQQVNPDNEEDIAQRGKGETSKPATGLMEQQLEEACTLVLRSNVDSLDQQPPSPRPIKNAESPDTRQFAILHNKYKSNLQYLQAQLKQLHTLHYQSCLQEQQRQLNALILQSEAALRRLRLEVNENKGRKSRMQENWNRICVLKGLIAGQRKISDRLRLRELDLENSRVACKEIVQEDGDGSGDEDYEPTLDKVSKQMVSKYYPTNPELKHTGISETSSAEPPKANTCQSSISAILNNSAYKPKPISYEERSCVEDPYRALLMERIGIMRESIGERVREYNSRASMLQRQKMCLRRSVELVKLGIIETENQRRRLSKVVLRQNSQSLFRTRVQKLSQQNNSQSRSKYAYSPGMLTLRQISPLSKSTNQGLGLSRNSRYYDAWREYQMSTKRICKAISSRDEAQSFNNDKASGFLQASQFHEEYYGSS